MNTTPEQIIETIGIEISEKVFKVLHKIDESEEENTARESRIKSLSQQYQQQKADRISDFMDAIRAVTKEK